MWVFRGSPAGRGAHSVWDTRICRAARLWAFSCLIWAGPARCCSDAPEPGLSRLETSSAVVSGECVCLSAPSGNHPRTPSAEKTNKMTFKTGDIECL